MCGRSSITKTEKELEKRFDATFYSDELERYNPLPNFNVAPSHFLPVIKNDEQKHFRPVRWGLIPSWAKDSKMSFKMINARIETVLEKNAYKNAIQKRRCIIPADGFYEWKREGQSKQAFRIVRQDQSIYSYAGIWESWINKKGENILSFSILTRDAHPSIKEIHDRMPVILKPNEESIWLSNDIPANQVIDMVYDSPEEEFMAYEVSDKVNNVRNNDKTLIEKSAIQGNLFD